MHCLKQYLPNSSERAFAYAKACGIIRKSFVGKRIAELTKPGSLNELDKLIFPDAVSLLPGKELLVDLERRIIRRTTQHILAIVNSFSRPPQLLIRQLFSYEYADLKNCLHFISLGRETPPAINDIGRFKTVRFEDYPNLEKMLAGTEYEFILAKDIDNIKSPDYNFSLLEAELDYNYYIFLAKSLKHLSVSDRSAAEKIISEEISLRNCIWALRLRIYYKKSPKETADYLMNIKMKVNHKMKDLSSEARQMLGFPVDVYSAWKGWRWEKLINSEYDGEIWTADPRFFQNAAANYLYRLSLRFLRHSPFSLSSIFCYIKLKQFEEDILTSMTEGLGLSMTGKEVFEMLKAKI